MRTFLSPASGKLVSRLGSMVALSAALALLGAGGCGAGEPPDLATIESPIINGTVLAAGQVQTAGLVAIYHPKLPQFAVYPRPCGGVVIRSVLSMGPIGFVSYVFTARHCVTVDETPGGTLAAPDQIHLIAAAQPMAANGNPPAGALPALTILDSSPQNDNVIVAVNVDWSAIANNRLALYLGALDPLVNQSFIAYGYGINVVDGNCPTDNSTAGAGIARSGSPFTVTGFENFVGGEPTLYKYSNMNGAGQVVTCGDSGGPDEVGFGPIAGPKKTHVLGVHATGVGSPATSTTFGKSLQDALLGLYLSAMNIGTATGTGAMNLGADASGNLMFVSATDQHSLRVTYSVPTHVITAQVIGNVPGPGAGCLGTVLGAQNVTVPAFKACDTSDASQKWTIDPSMHIRNDLRGWCLTAPSAAGVTLGPCTTFFSGGNQYWYLHAQP